MKDDNLVNKIKSGIEGEIKRNKADIIAVAKEVINNDFALREDIKAIADEVITVGENNQKDIAKIKEIVDILKDNIVKIENNKTSNESKINKKLEDFATITNKDIKNLNQEISNLKLLEERDNTKEEVETYDDTELNNKVEKILMGLKDSKEAVNSDKVIKDINAKKNSIDISSIKNLNQILSELSESNREYISSVNGGNSNIQFQNDGVDLGGVGGVNIIDFVGGGLDAERVGNKLTVNSVVPSNGIKTVLCGDSMTAFYHQQIVPTAASYVAATGIITFTYAGHNLWTGALAQVYCLSYASLRDPRWLPVTVIDANTYTVTLSDKPTDLPVSLTGIVFSHFETRLSAYSWVGMLQNRLNQRLNITAFSAQSGDWSAALKARLQRDVLDYNPQLVLMQSTGINDQTLTYLGLSQTPEDETIANLFDINDRILASGAKLGLLLITPVASGEARAQLGIMQRVQRINRALVARYSGNPNVAIGDSWSATVNPTDVNGLALPQYFKSTDKIHYSVLGAIQASKTLAGAITAWYPTPTSSLPASTLDSAQNSSISITTATALGGIVTLNRASGINVRLNEQFKISGATPAAANGVFRALTSASNNQQITYSVPGIADGALTGTILLTRSKNMFPDPLLTATPNGAANNGITGTIAHDLFLTNNVGAGGMTATASVANEPNGIGKEQLITVTVATTNDAPSFKLNTNTLRDNLIPGRSYQAEFQLRIASNSWADTPLLSILGQFQVVDSVTGLTYNVNGIEGSDGVTGTANYSEDQTFHIRTPVLRIPSGATLSACRLQVITQFGAPITNSKVLTLGLSRIAVWDVTND